MPQSHPVDDPTQAGGVVYRRNGKALEFLVVTARRRPKEWVLPKGTIESGETPEDAAVREVEEEAGVRASVERVIQDVDVETASGIQLVRFFLMKMIAEGPAEEGRRVRWLPLEEVLEHLEFFDSRELVREAARKLGVL